VSKLVERRAAKAVRRKKILAERRAGIVVSLTEKVRRLAARPVYRCLVQSEMFKTGIGTVILARQAETGQIAMAAFLVDTFSVGVKDVVFRLLEVPEFETYLAMAHEAAPLLPVEPAYARKLLRDAAAYAASLGVRPHGRFATVERLFGDCRAEDCSETFSFGCDGRPVYAVGPSETVAQVRRRLGGMVERLGPDGFEFVLPFPEGTDLSDDPALPLISAHPERDDEAA
jgi:hypothetical protein